MDRISEFDLPAYSVVQESAVEALIEANHLGTRLRRLRLKRSMGLVELGQLCSQK
jgi:hypothetical protein